jgi:hypothetical protein
MTSLRHRAVIWLLLSIVPFQGFIAVYLDLRGPAHFHIDHELLEHAEGHLHSHGHQHVDRHHHRTGDDTVVVAEDDGLELASLEEAAAQGGSGASFVAMISPGISLDLLRAPNRMAAKRDRPLETRFPGRLERPPRINPA